MIKGNENKKKLNFNGKRKCELQLKYKRNQY